MRLALSYLGNDEFSVLRLPIFFNKLFIVLCKTTMNSDKNFEVTRKINNDCKLKGYFVFNIGENVMPLLHRDIYSQSNIYVLL